MTMNDLVRQCNCKYATWSRDNPKSTTAWLWCKLHSMITDNNHCSKCKDRIPKYNKEVKLSE